jgi:hypothetical protein
MHLEVLSPSHTHCQIDLDRKCFSFCFWIHGISHGYVLRASSHTKEQKFTPKAIPKFYINPTPLWWRFQTPRGVPSFWSQTLSSLVLSNFFELLYLCDFVVSWLHFCWWTWNCLQRFLQNWRHFEFCMVFNFQCWTLSLVMWFDLSIAS